MLPRPGEEAVCGALGLQRPFPWPSEQITTVMSGDQASVLFRNKKGKRVAIRPSSRLISPDSGSSRQPTAPSTQPPT